MGVEVDGTVWSGGTGLVGGRPEVSATTSRKQGTSWEESSDFVLAYRSVEAQGKQGGSGEW